MARLAVLGERGRVAGYALAGAIVVVADDEPAVRAAWAELIGDGSADVEVVVLTRRAAAALPDGFADRARPLTVVMDP